MVLGLAVLLAHGGELEGPFVFDDESAIVDNPSIRALADAWSPPRHTPLAGRPLVNLSFALNHALGGLEPRGYRAANLAIHFMNALLLLGVLRRSLSGLPGATASGSADRLGFAATLLWAVHPLQSEAIHYVTQRTELLMASFYFATLYCALRAREQTHRRAWSAAAVGCCALGMACKEVMVTAPLVVLLAHWSLGADSLRDTFARRRGLYLGLAASWGVLAALLLPGPRSDTVGLGHGVGPIAYALEQSVVIVDYLWHVVWPHPLVLDYGPPGTTSAPHLIASLAALLPLLAGSVWALARHRRLGFWAAWLFVILAPSSSVIPIVTEVGAERRMYLALAGPCVLLVVGVAAALRRGLAARTDLARLASAAALLSLAVVALVLVSARRGRDYASNLSLWRSAVAARPHNAHARVNFGRYLALDGRDAEAEEQYRQALALDPEDVLANLDLGLVLQGRGEHADAIHHFQRAIELNRAVVQSHYALAQSWARLGRHEIALQNARSGLEIAMALGDAQWTARLNALIDALGAVP